MKVEFAENSIFKTLRNPVKLAVFAYLTALVLIGCAYAIEFTEIIDFKAHFPWLIMASMTLFYSLFSAIMLVLSGNVLVSWRNSLYSFIGFVLVGGLSAWLLSGKSIYEAGTYQSIYLVLTMAFFIFLAIGSAIKAVVRFTERRDEKKRIREMKSDE